MNSLSGFLLLSIFATSQISAEECKRRDGCECVYGDGSGYNLKPVVVGDNALKAITDQNLAFFFHPCGDIKTLPIHFTYETDNECRLGYTLCMYNSTENTARILGNQENMKFQLDGDTMQVIFITGGTSDNSRSSISLECAQTLKNSILYAPQEKIEQVNLLMFSKYACSQQIDVIVHHSFIYYFFVIAFTLLFVYLCMGMLINYFFIGARGYELIPNYDFWCKVWVSIKLGFMYVKNGCRVIPADDTYDAI